MTTSQIEMLLINISLMAVEIAIVWGERGEIQKAFRAGHIGQNAFIKRCPEYADGLTKHNITNRSIEAA